MPISQIFKSEILQTVLYTLGRVSQIIRAINKLRTTKIKKLGHSGYTKSKGIKFIKEIYKAEKKLQTFTLILILLMFENIK